MQMPQMESFFKLLYTGVTRCCNRLIFVETQDTPASRAFFRWLKKKDFAEQYIPPVSLEATMTSSSIVPPSSLSSTSLSTSSPLKVSSGEDEQKQGVDNESNVVYMSNDEWRLRGIDLLLATDDDSQSNLIKYKNALQCFDRAGESVNHLKEKVHAHIEAEKLKMKFMNYFRTKRSDSGIGDQHQTSSFPPSFTESKMPVTAEVMLVVLKCLKQGLLQEALYTADLMKPCLADTPSAVYFNREIIDRLKGITKSAND